MRSASIFRPRSHRRSLAMVRIMSPFGSKRREGRDSVAYALRAATRLTPALFSQVVTEACTRIGTSTRAGHTERLAHLVLSEAWIDATLFLVELELPLWRVRRLIYDGGDWLCSLSQHPGLPVELDPAADGRHAAMPIAILLALVEAKTPQHQRGPARAAAPTGTLSAARAGPAIVDPLCCDDFR